MLNQSRLKTFGIILSSPVSAKIPVPEAEEQKVRTESTRNVLPIYVCDTGSELCNLVDVLCFDGGNYKPE